MLRFLARRSLFVVVALVAASFGGFVYAYLARTGAGNPLFPGVLQIESGAQLACFMFVFRKSGPKSPVFLRIENAAFRSGVVPGDELILLCREFKNQKRRFISDVQGLVRDRVAFEARISGMIMDA